MILMDKRDLKIKTCDQITYDTDQYLPFYKIDVYVCQIYTNNFIFCFIVLLFYMLYVYTWCENDSAIENSPKTNYVTKF